MNEEKEKLAAGIWLSKMARYAGLSNAFVSQLLEYSKGIIALVEMNPGIIPELLSGPPEKIIKIKNFMKDTNHRFRSEEEATLHGNNGIRLLTCIDDLYPEKLRTISSSPSLLFFNGRNHEKILKQPYSIAIVGTRTPTSYGVAVTKKFVSEIAIRDVVVISGMARGIDSLAHTVALDNSGMTIAVLGCGLDIVYPPENLELMRRIINDGLIISECPPGTQPIRSYFPARNRIISGLSDCVAVMEASKKSGTMITASYAGDQGRDLFAVPGSIFSPHSTGTNKLIQDGACVLSNTDDMLWRLPMQSLLNIQEGIAADAVSTAKKTTKKNLRSNDRNIDPAIKKVLSYTEKTIGEIADDLGLTISKASEMISLMELSGDVIFQNGRFSLTESNK
ncbi:MAG: DNA-processing protein DprA [Saccharofermentanales bacterium]